MSRLFLLADDLTGANETGLHFIDKGYTFGTLLYNRSSFTKDLVAAGSAVEILAIDAETRLETGDKAGKTIRYLIKKLWSEGGRRFFLKCDSTLRGNIGVSIKAALEASGEACAAVCFAFPAAGRTTVGGIQYVYGKQITETEFAADSINPVNTSFIPQLLREQSGLKCGQIGLEVLRSGHKATVKLLTKHIAEGVRILVFDAESEKDLSRAAAAVKGLRIFCGASALAGELLPGKINKVCRVFKKTKGPVIGVIGSAKKQTIKQCRYAVKKAGLRQILLSEKDILKPESFMPVPGKKDLLLRIVHGRRKTINGRYAARLARGLGRLAARAIRNQKPVGIYLSGGATALGVCRELGIRFLEVKDKVSTGIPLVYSPELKLYLATKSGGFGKENALYKIYKALKS